MTPLDPNSPAWIAELKKINGNQANLIERLAGEHEDTNFCSVCGEGTTNTFKAPHIPLLIRLCDGCKTAQEDLYDYILTPVSLAS